jgi:malonyl-CoA/methylmalonyl-CoA synthetase
MTWPSPLLTRFQAFASTDRVAVIDEEGVHTYRDLDARARRIAFVLLDGRRSLEGERVAMLLSPGSSWVEAFFGILLAGGCGVVLSPLHPPAESSYFLDDAGVNTIVASADLQGSASAVASGRSVLSVAELRVGRAGRIVASPLAEDPALQLYTSGTTGKPKGAILTHLNLGVQQELLDKAWTFNADDVLLHALPLHHLHGLGIALLTALGAGAAALMLPRFDASAVWEALPRATVLMAVPTMVTKLLAALDAADPVTAARWVEGARRLRLATSGSAALPVRLGERWRAITGHYPVERFGMTEIGVGMTNPLAGERRAGTVGCPLPTVDARIAGEDGRDAASGELWIRGPSVFAGYHRRAEETAQAFVPAQDGKGAWFRTGDTVTRDEAGYFKILGRTSVDILKSGGYKLSALEIEEVLRDHPAVAEVAVVGLPDETWGERVVACVIAREGHEDDCREELLRAFCKERLANYKVPKTVVLVPELPRNAVGKVIKPTLVKRLLSS